MSYLRTIDGLRAIAVIPVVLFHAGIPGTRGGYIGVDIFFVISGFLITKSILSDIENNTFTIKRFYERRIRRIAPALLFVLFWSSIAATIFLSPDRLVAFSESLRAALLMYSNMHFAGLDGYFNHESDESLLIHFWSLAVEEQFYVIFPLVLLLLMKRRPQHCWLIITGTWIVSLWLATYSTSCKSSEGCFYSTPARAWELLTGALLVPIVDRIEKYAGPKMADIGCLTGLLFIGWSYMTFGNNVRVPGPLLLFPVIGTALVVLLGQISPMAKYFLGSRIFVATGLISYSLYLWHQPLLALGRVKVPGITPFWLTALIIFLSVLLAWLTYRFVETPWRDRDRTSINILLPLCITSLSALLLFSVVVGTDGRPSRFSTHDYTVSAKHSESSRNCSSREKKRVDLSDVCIYHFGPTTWAILGDSHGIEIAHATAEKLEKHGQSIAQFTHFGCPPAFDNPDNLVRCHGWHQPALNMIMDLPEVEDVILAFRHVAYTERDRNQGFSSTWRDTVNKFYSDTSRFSTQDSYLDAYWHGFNTAVEQLQGAGKNVHILWPVPELPAHIVDLAQPFSIFTDTPLVSLSKTTTLKQYYERHERIISRLNSIKLKNESSHIDPTDIYCDRESCSAVINDHALYYDDDHVSIAGAHLLIDGLIK